MNKSISIKEYGDFQTPIALAKEVLSTIDLFNSYSTIIEPTCGLGSFLQACIEEEVDLEKLRGWEINSEYVKLANQSLLNNDAKLQPIVEEQDFFKINWQKFSSQYKSPILFIGNPPWVTNSDLSKLLSNNLPSKRNIHNYSGIEAMTGKSNFDISEWMMIKLIDFVSGTDSALAFLIKTSVARKLFQYIVKQNKLVNGISIIEIDAWKNFNVNVSACLFKVQGISSKLEKYTCPIYKHLHTDIPDRVMGIVKGKIVSDLNAYKELSEIDRGSEFTWRSGVKHDASKVMEFDVIGNKFRNGYSEEIELPMDYLYPMYKSSQISKENISPPNKYMLITQKKTGDYTKYIEELSFVTWEYLITHSEKLDSRKSSIYKNAPRFAIFGVGDYSFTPWKVVVSGLYKKVRFSKIGSFKGKPIVLDDTCYMLGFEYEEQADFIVKLLDSDICRKFISSLIFLDSKRPVTSALLNRINTKEIARKLGLLSRYQELFPEEQYQMSFL